LTSEQLVMMAGGPPNIKEDIEMSMAEELKQQKLDLKAAGSAVVWNMPATWSKKVVLLSRCLHVTVQAEDSYPGKEGLQADRLTVQRSWTLSPPYPPAFMALLCILAGPANPEADMVAEIGLEELNGLEMEVMRRQASVQDPLGGWRQNHGVLGLAHQLAPVSLQLHVITGLRAVEDQGATWRHREAVFFAMLLSTCIANLWLWMHQCSHFPTLPERSPSCWKVEEVWNSKGASPEAAPFFCSNPAMQGCSEEGKASAGLGKVYPLGLCPLAREVGWDCERGRRQPGLCRTHSEKVRRPASGQYNFSSGQVPLWDLPLHSASAVGMTSSGPLLASGRVGRSLTES
ncbi:hypothetical protein EI555_006296, partial [Monodon monoceros]